MPENPEKLPVLADESRALTAGTVAVQMVSAIMEAARDPAIDVSKVERLIDLQERMMAKQAEQEYARAFSALQMELPEIEETKPIPDANGNIKYYTTPYKDIMAVLRPLLRKHGFSTSRSQSMTEKTCTEHLRVMHIGGHTAEHAFTVRIGSGPPKSSAEQGSGSAASHAARYALRDAFDLVFVGGERLSGNAESPIEMGTALDPETAKRLRDRVVRLGRDERRFLKFAGVNVPSDDTPMDDHYEQIMTSRLAELSRELDKVDQK